MFSNSIISRSESLQILKNTLRKAAFEKRANELKSANAEQRAAIIAEIDSEVEKALEEYRKRLISSCVIH